MLNDSTIKTKWIEALRSGNYTQTQGCLKDSKGNCCLGVLAEVANVPSTAPLGLGFQGGSWSFDFEGDAYGSNYAPPEGFCGLSEKELETLWRMNDDDDKSFSEIADYIERNL